MSNQVYANNMEVSCKQAAGKSICAFPDVCMTPPQTPATPPGVPIPYPNTGMASDTSDGSSSVRISGQEVMLKNKSYFKTSTGDEAGCAPMKGVVSHKNMGKVYFNAWSMDVTVEGENVVRNLDLTTHNHGSPPNEAIPFPYLDAVAMAVDGHPCEQMGKAIKQSCSGAKDYGSKCCEARQCLLAPYDPNSCCAGPDGEQMTPHHLLPSNVFVSSAVRKTLKGADPTTGYDPKKAPCLCVVGPSHHAGTEHGDIGTQYTAERNKWLESPANAGKVYTMDVGTSVAAKAGVKAGQTKPGAKGCDEDCLKKQLDHGHDDMAELKVMPGDPLPRAPQRADAVLG